MKNSTLKTALRLTMQRSGTGPEPTSRDVRYLVAIEGKAEMPQTLRIERLRPKTDIAAGPIPPAKVGRPATGNTPMKGPEN